MVKQQLFANNWRSTLAAGIGSGDTSMTVGSGHGALLQALANGNYYLATLDSSEGNPASTKEIVKITAGPPADAFTIARAQEGTSAAVWPLGTLIAMRETKGSFERNTPRNVARYNAGAPQIGLPGRVICAAPTTLTTIIQNQTNYTAFYVDRPIVVSEISCEVTTLGSGALIRLGVVAADDDLQPIGAALIDAEVSGASTGVKAAAVSPAVTLQPGWYLTLLNCNNASVRWRSMMLGRLCTGGWSAAAPTHYNDVITYPAAAWPDPVPNWENVSSSTGVGESCFVLLRWTTV